MLGDDTGDETGELGGRLDGGGKVLDELEYCGYTAGGLYPS